MEPPSHNSGSGGAPIALRGYHWSQAELEATPRDGIFYLAMNMTSACNYRCPYCFVGLQYLKTGKDEMTLEQKLRLVAEGADCGARVLSMPGRGEPLGDPHFWPILEEANRRGLYVVVYTNGYFLDEEKIKRLRDAGISLYVKVDSFDRAVYETLVGRKGVFDRVRDNLDLIIEHFHSPEIEDGRLLSRFGVNSVITVQSAGSIAELDRWCIERDVFYTCRSPVKVGEAAQTWEFLVGNQVLDLKAIGQRYAERNFTSGTPKGQCGIYRFGITIENNGEIYMCPDARIDAGFGRIGSFKDTPLRELILRRTGQTPLNSSQGFCYVKAALNPEEKGMSGEQKGDDHPMNAPENILPTSFGGHPSLPQLIDAALKHGVALWRGCSLDEAWFEDAPGQDDRVLPRAHFPVVAHQPHGFRGELSTKDIDQTITGPKPLPIHTDGLLSGAQVDLIILYAHDVRSCQGGQTVVVRQSEALDSMPSHLRVPIEDSTFEYQISDRDYFRDRPNYWHSIPTFRDYGRVRSLNLALPFMGRFGTERPSWDVRLPEDSPSENAAYFQNLTEHLMSPAHCFSHQWQTGDLLIMDNQRTLHGRLPFSPSDHRVLWRLQFALK